MRWTGSTPAAPTRTTSGRGWLTTTELVEILTSPDWLRFAFVRNPYDRLFSAYKAKMGNTWETEYRWLQDEIRTAFDYPIRRGERVGIVTFADYVRYVTESTDPRIRYGGHVDRQVEILATDCIEYDVLGRMESFVIDFQTVLRRLGAPGRIIASAVQVANPTPQVPLAAAYDKALADRVYAAYERDFSQLGYERGSWLFSA